MISLKGYLVVSAIVTILLGTVSHYVYVWTGKKFVVGLFFPVNESTWEHMKLVFFPILLVALTTAGFVEEKYPCIQKAFFLGILVGLILIPTLFYTYSGVLGFQVAWANILVYIVSIIAAYVVVYQAAVKCGENNSSSLRGIIYVLLVAFVIFSVYPPKIGLFQNPLASKEKNVL